MASKNIFTLTRWLVNSVYFLTVAACTFIVVLRTYQLFTGTASVAPGDPAPVLQFEVIKFNGEAATAVYQQSDNNKAYLETLPNRFNLKAAYKSTLGYYDYFISLVFIIATVSIVGLLRKLMNSVTADQPFLPENGLRIRKMGFWLIAVDMIKLLHYFVFGQIAKQYFIGTNVQLIISVGSGIWLGLLVMCLSVVYQKSVSIYHDQQLTV